jgi:hypothetical protein
MSRKLPLDRRQRTFPNGEKKTMNKFMPIEQIEIGTGATLLGYSDQYPYEVVKKTRTTLTVVPLEAERDPAWVPEFASGGFCARCLNNRDQRWILKPADPEAAGRDTLRLTKKGWHGRYGYFALGEAVRFYNYNF